MPDLFYVRSFDAAPFGARGWITPLNDLMERDGMDFSDFWPAQVAQNSYQGQLMTLPYDFSNVAIYYNKTMFDEVGVPYPTNDWTWDDCFEIAAAFQDGEPGDQTRWGLELWSWAWMMMGLLHAGGGATFTEDNRSCIVNNPENVATLQRIQDEMAAGNAVHRGMTPAGLDSFVTGSIAMEMQGSWAAFYMLEGIGDAFEWDIVKLPRGSTGLTSVSAAGGAWGIGTNTEDLDVAWEFCKYITNTESTNILISNNLRSVPRDGFPPCRAGKRWRGRISGRADTCRSSRNRCSMMPSIGPIPSLWASMTRPGTPVSSASSKATIQRKRCA